MTTEREFQHWQTSQQRQASKHYIPNRWLWAMVAVGIGLLMFSQRFWLESQPPQELEHLDEGLSASVIQLPQQHVS